MTIPLLNYPSSSQNQRVIGYEVPGDEQPMIYSCENLLSPSEMDNLIMAAYRQIFNEQQMTLSSRQVYLESQLRSGQITVRDFIRGLATSDVFRTRNYDSNNNYRFVQMCVQRILGREVYNEREKFSWSIVLATKGLKGFIDDLLNSEEYINNFGYDTVPFQQRRVLPQRTQGDLPFARMARYDEYYRDKLPKTSIYGQFAAFDWSRFVREADWKNVAGVIMLFAVITIFTLLIGYGLNPIG
ncbi:phycobilisome rod-core linker polypeptide [Calothrix rhizosoleniae]|uniref:phycobilisome rod-core linker polypeptide n=1 Tax=Calothrix rhizosoleniae TaxID=888997 RepID=UPI000B497DB0|nr:phycobilisome rod-core linker polypeptide [Calothrix rhizosoleniae]